MTGIITAQDIANYAPDLDTSGFNSTTISGLISQITDRMAAFCNVKGFDQAEETDEVNRAIINNKGELSVFVRRRPIVSIESITLKRGGFSTSLTLLASDGTPLYDIPDPGGYVFFPNSYLYLTGTYLAGGSSQLLTLKAANMFCHIDYFGGYSPIPDDLKYAAVLWVRDYITVKKINPGGVQSFSQGSLSMNFGAGSTTTDSAFIQEAKQILTQGGYVKVGSF